MKHASRDMSPACVDCRLVSEMLLAHIRQCLKVVIKQGHGAPPSDCTLEFCQALVSMAQTMPYNDIINKLTAKPG